LINNALGNASIEAMTEQNIVATVAHELAHQWFGNIVTSQFAETIGRQLEPCALDVRVLIHNAIVLPL
jgi:hypothetical protein